MNFFSLGQLFLSPAYSRAAATLHFFLTHGYLDILSKLTEVQTLHPYLSRPFQSGRETTLPTTEASAKFSIRSDPKCHAFIMRQH